MRDGFVFYRSFFDAIRIFPPEQQAEIYNAICLYALDGIPYEGEEDAVRIVFTLVKPQIDANNLRYENGKKGGRPRKKTDEKPMVSEFKTNGFETENQRLQNSKPKEKDKVKDKDKEKVKERHRYGAFSHVLLSDAELERLHNDFEDWQVDEAIRILDEALEVKGYKYKNHNLVLRGWVMEEVNKRGRPKQATPEQKTDKLQEFQKQYKQVCEEMEQTEGKEYMELKLRKTWLEDNMKRLQA